MTLAFVQLAIFLLVSCGLGRGLVLDLEACRLDNCWLLRSFAPRGVRTSQFEHPFCGSERLAEIFCHMTFASVVRAFSTAVLFLHHGKHNPRLCSRRPGLFVVWTDLTLFGIWTCTTTPFSEQRELRHH